MKTYPSLENMSRDLASELSRRTRFDLKEVETIIMSMFKVHMDKIIVDLNDDVNRQYISLKEKASLAFGKPEYAAIGLRLSKLKDQKAGAPLPK